MRLGEIPSLGLPSLFNRPRLRFLFAFSLGCSGEGAATAGAAAYCSRDRGGGEEKVGGPPLGLEAREVRVSGEGCVAIYIHI